MGPNHYYAINKNENNHYDDVIAFFNTVCFMCTRVCDLDGSFSTSLMYLTTVLAGISSSHVPFVVYTTAGNNE